jgi:hypothetical protein
MNALRNKVQLIHVGNDPEIKILKEEKISQFYINESYKMTREKSGGNAMASISRLGKLLILWRNRYQR